MNKIKCAACGFVGWDDVELCKKCGVPLVPDPSEGASQTQQSYLNQSGDQSRSGGELKRGLAIWSLVVGIISFLTFSLLGVGAALGMTLGMVALVKANKHPTEYGGKGLAIAGLATSVLSIVIVVPIAIIAAIAIPNLLASRIAANEGSAIQMLRTISTAEANYQAVHGTYGTSDQLALEKLIDPEVATGTRRGYRFKIAPFTPGSPSPSTFEVVGVPLTYPSSGRRSFYIDETYVIFAADKQGAEATKLDPPLNSSELPATRTDEPGDRY